MYLAVVYRLSWLFGQHVLFKQIIQRIHDGAPQPIVECPRQGHIYRCSGRLAQPLQRPDHINTQIRDRSVGARPLTRDTNRTPRGLLELFRTSSPDAAFDSVDRFPPPKCLPGTRTELLNEVERWINLHQTKICWIHGPAGAGKSAIAQTVSETCSARRQLAASFFFSRSAPSRSHARWFFTTIALQIAHSMPQMREAICKAVEDDMQIPHKEHPAQLKQLLMLPLLSPSSSSVTNPPFLVIVDGLDECDGDQSRLLLYILELVEIHQFPLRFLIFSRPEPQISHFFDSIANGASTRISIYGDHRAREDVRLFLRTGFNEIHNSERHAAIMKHVSKPWPSDEIVQLLVDQSSGYFIYASTVLKYVDEIYPSCIDRLREILEISKPGSSAFAELDKLYMQILSIYLDTDLLLRVLGGFLTTVRSKSYSPPESVKSLQATWICILDKLSISCVACILS